MLSVLFLGKLSLYTQLHKWLPEVNKQKIIQPLKRSEGWRSRQSLFIDVNNLWWICRIFCESEGMLHWFTQYIHHSLHFNQNTISKRAVYWPYWYELGGGVPKSRYWGRNASVPLPLLAVTRPPYLFSYTKIYVIIKKIFIEIMNKKSVC